MNKKDIFAPVLIIALSGIFIFVALAVFFTKGKSAFWVSKKIKIGALLLSLTAMYQSCGNNQPHVTCYVVPQSNVIEINDLAYNDTLKINIDTTNKISGYIYDRRGESFTFNLTDTSRTNTLQKGIIQVQRRENDSLIEDFSLQLDTFLRTDYYYLNFFTDEMKMSSYLIKLIHEKE